MRWPTTAASERGQYRCPPLVRVAGTRWRIEETFQATKGLAGLDEHQVRRHTPWLRWVTLAMLAHAFLAVIRADEHREYPAPTGLIALTWTVRADPSDQRIRDTVIDRVLDGTYPEGDKIPSFRTLAQEFGVLHHTVDRALAPLEQSGLLVTRHGGGTFVHRKARSWLQSAQTHHTKPRLPCAAAPLNVLGA